MSKKERIFPESGVELSPFMSKHYDRVLSLATMGRYPRIIKQAIKDMEIQPDDRILDLGCGTGYNASLMAHYLGAKGRIQGIDISDEMAGQFQERFHEDNRMTFLQQRIDQPLELGRKFNKVFISFVIHGFPHEVRLRVIENALSHLEEGGSFYIFDFAEFDMNAMPSHHRFIFKSVECPYAFDYIKRHWKSILKDKGFEKCTEHLYMRDYVRLLRAVK